MGFHASATGPADTIEGAWNVIADTSVSDDEAQLYEIARGIATRALAALPHDLHYTINAWAHSSSEDDGLQVGDWIRVAVMLTGDGDPEPGSGETHRPFTATWEGPTDEIAGATWEIDRDDLTGDEDQILDHLIAESADAVAAAPSPAGHHRVSLRGYSATDHDGFGPGDLLLINVELLPDVTAEREQIAEAQAEEARMAAAAAEQAGDVDGTAVEVERAPELEAPKKRRRRR